MSENQATRKLLVEYYAAMESNDPLRYSTYYADEMTLTFGNSPTITGRENIAVAMAEVDHADVAGVAFPGTECHKAVVHYLVISLE